MTAVTVNYVLPGQPTDFHRLPSPIVHTGRMPSAAENDVDDRPKRQSDELHSVPDEKSDQHIEPKWSGLTAEVDREASARHVDSGKESGREGSVDNPRARIWRARTFDGA